MYKSFPCWWQVKNKEYNDCNKRNPTYEELVTKYKEVDSKANKERVTKEINTVRLV